MSYLKNIILSFVNKPTPDILSSQTLYEVFFYLNNFVERYSDDLHYVISVIVDTQLDDGGFDIGYDFQYGPSMSKKSKLEGTSPELLSLTALSLYESRFPNHNPRVKPAIRKAVDWILTRLVKTQFGVAIPYAPDSFDGIHITNATSFCISALSTSAQHFNGVEKANVVSVVESMYDFMHAQLVYETESSAYWPYFYQYADENHKRLINSKVDNYHIAQQLYHHYLAEKYLPNANNRRILELTSEYLFSKLDDEYFVPYTIFKGAASGKIHLWGYSSLIPAFVSAYEFGLGDKYKRAAIGVFEFIKKYCVCEDHFAPIILINNKKLFDSNFYPRSDAWVLHGISALNNIDSLSDNWVSFCYKVYSKMKKEKFRGLENHVVTLRMKLFAILVRVVKH